jgi:mono/diheme cytochrome c family protein
MLAAPGTGSIRTIDLPHYQPNLPDAPGREAFASACLICHSSRYIAMQPPITAAKWEENVRKMMKVFAAPVPEEQVGDVVKYAIFLNEQSAQAGLRDSLAVEARSPVSDRSPDNLWTDQHTVTGDLQRGAALFQVTCANCHSVRGQGQGRAAAAHALPAPTDLTSGRWSRELLASVLRNGVRGTAMPAWPTVSENDLRAVIFYARQLGPEPQKVQPDGEEVRSLYQKNCAICHGTTGAADGLASPVLPRPAANFRLKQPTSEHALHIITDGVPGTTMPPWKLKLSEDQRRLLAEYVRSFYAEN